MFVESRARLLPSATVVVAALAAVLLLPASETRATAPDPPPYFAIVDARVVTGTGQVFERATVLLADGLIEAVGSDLKVPADAWVIPGEGLTVFPGLIDGLTTLAQKAKEEAPRSEGGSPFGGGGPTIRGPEDRPATTPWVAAADSLSTEDRKVEQWREAGFTAAVTAPADGLFAGQAALINLGGHEPGDMVVATPVAQRMNLRAGGGFRSFPGSLMGVLSYVKQTFLDAGHYAEARALYASSPAGRERPDYDRALDPIAAAMADGLAFLMPADLGRHLDRALAIAAEHELEAVLYGAHGAYERIDALAASGAAVLVSLEWPEEETDRNPDADTPFRTLYHRRMAPTVPARLAAAGVPFAFYSDGLSSASKVLAAVRAAVEAGLAPEDALAALTSQPARIFGVGRRLGTVERGKIANLVVASDYPWAEDVEIEAVFVDGRKYQEREEDEDEASEPPAADVSGTWALTLTTPRGTSDLTAELEMSEDGKVTGELKGERGDREVEKGRMSGDLLTFKTTQTMGDRTMEASFTLSVEGEEISGSMSAGPMTMDLSGSRTAQPEVKSADAGDREEAEEVTAEEYERVLALYQGPAERLDSWAVTNATVYTVSGEVIENGTVVVEDGKIRAVGADVQVPRGARVFDAAGGSLIPGIIDAHSHIAVEGGVNEGSLAVTSMVTIQDVLNPDDVAIYRALAGGVTSANILHGSANPIGGGNAVVKLRWGADADGLRFQGAKPGIKFALGENPKRARFRFPGVTPRYPGTRMGVMDVIRQAFREAQEYREDWRQYEAATRTGRKVIPPRRDLELEALVEILEGERWVHSHCYRADEILQLLRLAEEFGFRIRTLQHVLEGYKVADEIAAHGAGASTFSDWWGYKIEAYDAIPHNAALMTERGVLVSVNSDSGEEMRHLNQEAAKAIKWGGLSEAEALKLVTLNPAIQFGIDDRVGSIEVGKDADLVLYDGPPLAVRSVVQKTWVDGDLYFDLEADRVRQAAIDEIEKRILGDEDEEGEDGEEAAEAEADDAEAEPDSASGASPPDPPRVFWSNPNPYSCREESR